MAENDIQTQQPAAQDDTQAAPRFSVQRIYVKDASFEAPDSPECFRRPYNPQINFNINSRSRKLDENFYEVILRLTADVKQDDKTLFLFEVGGLEGERLEQVLMITCPNILFPYGREAIDSLVIKGSFPALMLAPVNFEAVYLQAKRNQAEQAQAGGVN
jgi:preprotein translocase subunit SecB